MNAKKPFIVYLITPDSKAAIQCNNLEEAEKVLFHLHEEVKYRLFSDQSVDFVMADNFANNKHETKFEWEKEGKRYKTKLFLRQNA